MRFEPNIFSGVACLLFCESRLVLEIRKVHKWEREPGKPPVIGMGSIGGTIETGETPLQALHRESMEEIQCGIDLWSARVTVDSSPKGTEIVDDVELDGIRPAMVWEVTSTFYEPGTKVAVFLGKVNDNPQPGDLPAIVLADPQLILSIGTGVLSIAEAKAMGAVFRANTDLPDAGQLKLANTLAHVYRLHETHANLFDELVQGR